MPTYQYVCTDCGGQLEVVQKFSDAPLTQHEACGGKLRKVFSPVGIVFKGSGFYRTDSRNGSGSGANASSSASNGSAEDKSGKSEKSGEKAEKKADKTTTSSSSGSGSSSSSSSSSSGSSTSTKVA